VDPGWKILLFCQKQAEQFFCSGRTSRIEPNCPVVRRAAQGTEKHKPRLSSLGPEEGLGMGSVFVSCEEDGVNAFQDGADRCLRVAPLIACLILLQACCGNSLPFHSFPFTFVGSVMEQ
jgi:hypothetical protein